MSLNDPHSATVITAVQAGTIVAQDIPSLRAAGTAGSDGMLFVTPQEAYTVLSYELPRQLLVTVNEGAAHDSDIRDAAIATLFDIYLDLLRLARALIDLAFLRSAGATPAFDAASSPILAYLTDEAAAPTRTAAEIFLKGHGNFARARSIPKRLRTLKHSALMALTPRAGRHDVIAQGALVGQYLASDTHASTNINPYLIGWPEAAADMPSTLSELVEALCIVFDDIVAPHTAVVPDAGTKAAATARVHTRARLAQAFTNARHLENSMLARFHGDVLIGSAPKTLGRLIARFYQTEGARVVRCAHGGDRAFYDDDHWGLSELPFCDAYLTHSGGEAMAIAHRHAEDRLIRVHANAPECIALGSKRHQTIYRDTHTAPQVRKRRNGRPRVMLAASSFLGEGAAHIPAVKPADIHLADLQVWLMKQLRADGFEIVFKPHPKSVVSAMDLFDGLYDDIDLGPFDPATQDVDAYLFEYAGSAFFDALASARGIVLIHHCLRPFDPTTVADLRTRCEIVDAPANEANRFRPDPAAFIEAVDRATQVTECSEQFAHRFFFAPANS